MNNVKVHVEGVSLVNKGAELMLRSIVDGSKTISKHRVSTLFRVVDKESAKELGVERIPEIRTKGPIGHFLPKLPNTILKPLGYTSLSDRNLILDASGFFYSDQWGAEGIKHSLNFYKRWCNEETKLVLMPQAFGPFEDKAVAEITKQIIDLADLVFVRDRVSLDYVHKLVGKLDKIVLSPDFTNLLKARQVEFSKISNYTGKVAIIPNYRMVDKGVGRDSYYNALVSVIKELESSGQEFYFLIHDTDKDKDIVLELESIMGKKFDSFTDNDPLILKAYLGQSKFVIGSRFHGLISALSQGVPVISLGWSHKYHELLADYDIAENYIDFNNKDSVPALDRLLDPESFSEIKVKVETNAKIQKEKSILAWYKIKELASTL